MPLDYRQIADTARLAALNAFDAARGLVDPHLRLGVTGLSRAGKTVFVTALIDALTRLDPLPVFEPMAGGRIIRARLAPQPDDAVARFDIESHLATMLGRERAWPHGTTRISELRLIIEYQSAAALGRPLRTLTLDIVDYPGEWLLDLPLLDMSYAEWSAKTIEMSRQGPRAAFAAQWHQHLATLDAAAPEKESLAIEAARLFTDYLSACRNDRYAMSLLPPGRFLMPGDMAGSPALTFAPLAGVSDEAAEGSLGALMARRFEAYKRHVVRPFFRDHFARLDRQIVLVDVLAALNAGPAALAELETALDAILAAFRAGRNDWLSSLFRPRIDRVLFAATKADHLHHTMHDRLEAVLHRLTDRAIARASGAGAAIDVIALAAVRATREGTVTRGRSQMPVIIGTPLKGEAAGEETYDGETEVAVFPGELPADPDHFFDGSGAGFQGLSTSAPGEADYRFLRFRPPLVGTTGSRRAPLPHIRLDRALNFLLADKLA